MRKIALIGLMGLGLTACNDTPSRVNWSRDCQRNYSYDGQELDVCKKKVTTGIQFQDVAGRVYVDPYNVSRPDMEELGKSRNRD